MNVGGKAPESGPWFQVRGREADGRTWKLAGRDEVNVVRDWLLTMQREERLAVLARMPEVQEILRVAEEGEDCADIMKSISNSLSQLFRVSERAHQACGYIHSVLVPWLEAMEEITQSFRTDLEKSLGTDCLEGRP